MENLTNEEIALIRCALLQAKDEAYIEEAKCSKLEMYVAAENWTKSADKYDSLYTKMCKF